MWGSDCSTPCAVNCTDEHCYPGNGRCVWDCKIGQDGDMCEKRKLKFIFLNGMYHAYKHSIMQGPEINTVHL